MNARWAIICYCHIILASLFLIITGIVEHYNLDYLEATLMSIYLQLIIFIGLGSILRGLRVENIDFEVYKEKGCGFLEEVYQEALN